MQRLYVMQPRHNCATEGAAATSSQRVPRERGGESSLGDAGENFSNRRPTSGGEVELDDYGHRPTGERNASHTFSK